MPADDFQVQFANLRRASAVIQAKAEAAKVEAAAAAAAQELLQDKMGHDGYAGKICGLMGMLAQYNGLICNPRPSKESGHGQWDAVVTAKNSDGDLEKVALTLPRKSLELIIDMDYQPTALGSDRTCGTNRSSVKILVDSLTAQFRTAMRRQDKPLIAIFNEMDLDHSGFIEPHELIEGCRRVDIAVSSDNIDLMMPLFDADGDGKIEIAEFVAFMSALPSGVKAQSAHVATKQQRQDRIARKSALRERLQAESEALRSVLVSYSAHRNITATEFFSELDLDHDGGLDRNELCQGLHRLRVNDCGNDQVTVTSQLLDLLWPVMTGSTGRRASKADITMADWVKFLGSEVTVGTDHLLDRFTKKFQVGEAAVAVAAQGSSPGGSPRDDAARRRPLQRGGRNGQKDKEKERRGRSKLSQLGRGDGFLDGSGGGGHEGGGGGAGRHSGGAPQPDAPAFSPERERDGRNLRRMPAITAGNGSPSASGVAPRGGGRCAKAPRCPCCRKGFCRRPLRPRPPPTTCSG
jgi:Ca2+-binding EF-hand superfamily protein